MTEEETRTEVKKIARETLKVARDSFGETVAVCAIIFHDAPTGRRTSFAGNLTKEQLVAALNELNANVNGAWRGEA